MKKVILFFCFMMATDVVMAAPDVAVSPLPDRIARPMVAVDSVTLQSEGQIIHLWGIKPAQVASAPLELKALDLMDKLIGAEPVNCKVVSGTLTELWARCTVSSNQDIALELLANGYAVMDRHQTYNSVFATAYAEAQETARLKIRGVWRFVEESNASLGGVTSGLGAGMMAALAIGPFGGLLVVALIMQIWFRRISLRQQEDTEQERRKEAALQARERRVLLATLESEMVENKNKVEAFVLVYKDMLRDLKTPSGNTPKYQQVGDTVQKHPSCSHAVFEANVSKLSLLDIKLAGTLSKLYAALPKNQEYINLEPDEPLDTAVKLIEKIVSDAESFVPYIDQVIHGLQGAIAQERG